MKTNNKLLTLVALSILYTAGAHAWKTTLVNKTGGKLQVKIAHDAFSTKTYKVPEGTEEKPGKITITNPGISCVDMLYATSTSGPLKGQKRNVAGGLGGPNFRCGNLTYTYVKKISSKTGKPVLNLSDDYYGSYKQYPEFKD